MTKQVIVTFRTGLGSSFKSLVHPEIKVKSSVAHSGVVLMHYDQLSFLDHKGEIKRKICPTHACPCNGSG